MNEILVLAEAKPVDRWSTGFARRELSVYEGRAAYGSPPTPARGGGPPSPTSLGPHCRLWTDRLTLIFHEPVGADG